MSYPSQPEYIPPFPDIGVTEPLSLAELVVLGKDITRVVYRPRVLPLSLILASRLGVPLRSDEVLPAFEKRAAPYGLSPAKRPHVEKRVASWLSRLTDGHGPHFYNRGVVGHTLRGERLLSLVGLHALRTLHVPDEQAVLFPTARRSPFAAGQRLMYLQGLLEGLNEANMAKSAGVGKGVIAVYRKSFSSSAEGIIEYAPTPDNARNNFRVAVAWEEPVRRALAQHHAWATNPDYADELAELAMEVAHDPDLMLPLALSGLHDFLDAPNAPRP